MEHPSLTEHLLSIEPAAQYAATHHPFLTHAGNGTLPFDTLAFWLSQDRIYAAHAYPRFIGALISRIPFHGTDAISGPAEAHNQDILQVLVKCLDNIVEEVSFFDNTAIEFGLDLDRWKERKATRDYTAEMSRVSSSASFEDGLIFLWAMEKIYLDAWSYVKESQDLARNPNSQIIPVIRKFATNWSSPEFEDFVTILAALVNNLEIQPGSQAWNRAEVIWLRVLELENVFWPPVVI